MNIFTRTRMRPLVDSGFYLERGNPSIGDYHITVYMDHEVFGSWCSFPAVTDWKLAEPFVNLGE